MRWLSLLFLSVIFAALGTAAARLQQPYYVSALAGLGLYIAFQAGRICERDNP